MGTKTSSANLNSAAWLVSAAYRAATASPLQPPSGWVDTEGFSPWRDAALRRATEAFSPGLSLAQLRDRYRTAALVFERSVHDESVTWACAVLDRQVPHLKTLAETITRNPLRLHHSAVAAMNYSSHQTIYSGSGRTLHPDEAAALSPDHASRGHAVDRFERVRFTRAVRAVNDAALIQLMLSPEGVRIVKRFAESADGGRNYALACLARSRAAIATVQAELRTDPRAVWRLPPAVAGGVASLGIANKHQRSVDFALAWAALRGQTRAQTALATASNAVLLLDLYGGPLGRAAASVLDVVLNSAATALSFLQALEQDRAGTASAFAPGEEKLSEGGDYLGVAFQGVAALAAALAVPGAVRRISQRGARTAELTSAAAPPLSLKPSTGRATSARALEGGAISEAERATARSVASAGRKLDEDALAMIAKSPDELARLQRQAPLADLADPGREQLIRSRSRDITEGARRAYGDAVAVATLGRRDPALAVLRLEWAVDTTALKGAAVTSAGFPRNSRAFWKELFYTHPYLFSPANQRYIREGLAPHVDDWWLYYHPNQTRYRGDILVHHHIEQGPWAVGIPQQAHRDFYPELHPFTNPDVLE